METMIVSLFDGGVTRFDNIDTCVAAVVSPVGDTFVVKVMDTDVEETVGFKAFPLESDALAYAVACMA